MESRGNTTQSIAIAVLEVLQSGAVAVLVTLLDAGGSANAGGKMLVNQSAPGVIGSFGNADLDCAVIEQAARFLESRVDTRSFRVKEFAPALAAWGEAQVLFERLQPEPRLVICGAGHVGASLAKLASFMGYRATLIDDRAEFVSPDRFPEPNIELVLAQNWTEAVRAAVSDGFGVSVAIVTRGHSEDEQCLRAIIDADLDYVGLIGSKRRTRIVLERLRDAAAAPEKLARVHAPVGLDIGAVTPEEVALAIMAEVVAVRRGGKGGSLSRPGEKGNL